MRLLKFGNMAASRSLKLFLFAVFTRLCVIILQIIINNLIPDHQADAFHQKPISNVTTGDKVIEFLLDGFTKWDAAYFLHIAEEGYTQQHMFAFFPLFPMAVRVTAYTLLYPLQYAMNLKSVFVMSAVLLNFCAFPVSAHMLFKLGCYVLADGQMAYRASLFFCINPASVFMSAAYTEIIFAMFTFAGMLKLEQGQYMSSAFLFAASGATRSNGLVSLGFVLYGSIKAIVMRFSAVVRKRSRIAMASLYGIFLYRSAVVILSAGIVFLPFSLFQLYVYMAICTEYSMLPSFIRDLIEIPEVTKTILLNPSWCDSALPIPYSMIQSQHWENGFLQYYEVKQIPNFFLALPLVALCCSAIVDYCSNKWEYVKLLGVFPSAELKKYNESFTEPTHHFYDDAVFVYLAHTLFLVLFGVTCMHVQVVTRFLASSCPVIYWYTACLTSDSRPHPPPTIERDKAATAGQSKLNKLAGLVLHNTLTVQISNWKSQCAINKTVYIYFFLYNILGIALHCNFLPWT